MKMKCWVFLFVFTLLTPLMTILYGDPFAAKFQNNYVKKPKLENYQNIKYLGYLQISGKYHGVVEFDNKQLIISQSDTIGKILITKIEQNYIKYRLKNREYTVKVARNLD